MESDRNMDIHRRSAILAIGGVLPAACATAAGEPLAGVGSEGPITDRYESPNILYVDPIGGTDNNDGLAPGRAKASIQAAYDAIPTKQIDKKGEPTNMRAAGQINVLPGRHDVRSGLHLSKSKPVEIVGITRPQRRVEAISGRTDDVGAVIFASRDPHQLVGIGVGDDTTQNAYGFVFRRITFELRGSTAYAIKAHDTNFMVVEDCGARHFDVATTLNSWLVGSLNQGVLLGQDTSWHRIINNCTTGVGLYQNKVTAPEGRNSNQHVIRDNVCFGHSRRTEALIYLEHCQGSTIQSNNLETGAIAIEFGASKQGFTVSTSNLILGNSGEAIDTWLKADRFYGNIVIDTGSRHPQRGQHDHTKNSKLYDLSKRTGNNLILDAVSTRFGELYNENPLAVVDSGSGNLRIDPKTLRNFAK